MRYIEKVLSTLLVRFKRPCLHQSPELIDNRETLNQLKKSLLTMIIIATTVLMLHLSYLEYRDFSNRVRVSFNAAFMMEAISKVSPDEIHPSAEEVTRVLVDLSLGMNPNAPPEKLSKEIAEIMGEDPAFILKFPLYKTPDLCSGILLPLKPALINPNNNYFSLRNVYIFYKSESCGQLDYAHTPSGVVFDENGKLTHFLYEKYLANIIVLKIAEGKCDLFNHCISSEDMDLSLRLRYFFGENLNTFLVPSRFDTNSSLYQSTFVPLDRGISENLIIVNPIFIGLNLSLSAYSLEQNNETIDLLKLSKNTAQRAEREKSAFSSALAEQIAAVPILGILIIFYFIVIALIDAKNLVTRKEANPLNYSSLISDRSQDSYLLRLFLLATPILTCITMVLIFQDFYQRTLFNKVYINPLRLYLEFFDSDRFGFVSMPYGGENIPEAIFILFSGFIIYFFYLAIKLTKRLWYILL